MTVWLAAVATVQVVEQGRTRLTVVALVGGLDEKNFSSELLSIQSDVNGLGILESSGSVNFQSVHPRSAIAIP